MHGPSPISNFGGPSPSPSKSPPVLSPYEFFKLPGRKPGKILIHIHIAYDLNTRKQPHTKTHPHTYRPSHLKIPGGPKMTRAAICRRAIYGPCAVIYRPNGANACLVFGSKAGHLWPVGPVHTPLDGPKMARLK